MLPPLNQTLWMLLVVSLIVVVCLGAPYLLGAAHGKAESKRRSDLFSPSRPRRRRRLAADESGIANSMAIRRGRVLNRKIGLQRGAAALPNFEVGLSHTRGRPFHHFVGAPKMVGASARAKCAKLVGPIHALAAAKLCSGTHRQLN